MLLSFEAIMRDFGIADHHKHANMYKHAIVFG